MKVKTSYKETFPKGRSLSNSFMKVFLFRFKNESSLSLEYSFNDVNVMSLLMFYNLLY